MGANPFRSVVRIFYMYVRTIVYMLDFTGVYMVLPLYMFVRHDYMV